MVPNQEVKQLSRMFGVRVKRMTIVQNGVYRIVTSQGREFCLKRMPYPIVQLRWIDTTLQQIRRKRSIRLGWRNPREKLGKRLFAKRKKYDSPPFVLIPWYRGAWPSPQSSKQMRACGTLLAQFHRVGQQIKITKAGRQNKMGSWPSYLRQEQHALRKAIDKAKKRRFRSPLDSMLQKHGNELLRMANDSLRALRTSHYKTLCRTTKATLCHGDFGPTNIIRTSKGMVLIDFETLRLDLRTFDLYKLIFNSCQYHSWKFSTAKSILDGYQKVYKLKRSDFQMLKILLRFPRGICKHIQNYDKKSPREKLLVERDFLKVLNNERRRNTFLRKLDNYAR